jgi:hypothetical protein|mmetsp:Transcript_42422/g.71681  ORF Transcript_42422/g.71681 Transcript_42422/m.71681 type:complete len:91 (-) Transcript_42422:466-738(-)
MGHGGITFPFLPTRHLLLSDLLRCTDPLCGAKLWVPGLTTTLLYFLQGLVCFLAPILVGHRQSELKSVYSQPSSLQQIFKAAHHTYLTSS